MGLLASAFVALCGCHSAARHSAEGGSMQNQVIIGHCRGWNVDDEVELKRVATLHALGISLDGSVSYDVWVRKDQVYLAIAVLKTNRLVQSGRIVLHESTNSPTLLQMDQGKKDAQ